MSWMGQAVADDYDPVIDKGRVMGPETNYDEVANVGIRDGRIVIVAQEQISGKET